MVTEQELLREIKRARDRVAHWKQWHKEPSCAKRLRHWRYRLKKALAAAKEQSLEIPPDPTAPPPPPPPPPTEEELAAAALAEIKGRVRLDWQVTLGHSYWAPWGDTGWSAVVITRLKRVWCRARRVNPRTEETTTTKANVRRDRLVKRDPDLKGKDRPAFPVDALFSSVAEEPEPIEEPEPAPKPQPKPLTPEEKAAQAQRMSGLMSLLDDDSTTSDW
jgi:hypothetical protein